MAEENRREREWRNPERKQSILTERERRYLLGELDLSGQDERNIRYQIRSRMIEGIRDLQLLSDSEFQDRDMSQVLESVDSLVTAGALSYIAFRGLDESLVGEGRGMTGDRVKDFKFILMEAINSAEGVIGDGGAARVDVEIEVDRGIINEEEVWEKMITHEATEREFNIWTNINGFDRIHKYEGTVGFKAEDGETKVFGAR